MFIVKQKECLAKEIFDGRNSEWFSNLQQDGWNNIYDHLPIQCGFSPDAPDEFEEKYKDKLGYYGFNYIKVSDFKEWFVKYRPDIDAGWVTTYEKWRIEKKGYVPEDLCHYLSEDDDIRDMHFVEVENKYDCSKWLYDYLKDHDIPNDATIWYCFDC